MEILVSDLQQKVSISPSRVVSLVSKILSAHHILSATVSVTFVSRQKISALNKQFLGKAYATDVLAFDLRDTVGKKTARACQLHGEIIISTDAVVQNAQQYNQPVARELALYLIHGILHLLGYDDHAPADIKQMRRAEQEMLATVRAYIAPIVG